MNSSEKSHTAASAGAYAGGPRLLADIGATRARFTLETAPGRFESLGEFNCDDFPGIVPLVHAYLATLGQVKLLHAAFAIANPVEGDQVFEDLR